MIDGLTIMNVFNINLFNLRDMQHVFQDLVEHGPKKKISNV